jgi:endonuclease/exonuclease/phosphatase (EEP) superfamily protein YafD
VLQAASSDVTNSAFSTRDFVLNRVLVLFAIPAVVSLLAVGARWHWLLDLATHFRAYYLAAMALATMICLVARRFKPAAAFGALALLNIGFVAPLYVAASVADGEGTPVRVMTVNAYCANQQRDLLLQYIAETSPDVILAMEIDGGWAARLEALSITYPHQLIEPRHDDCFGIALLSKLPARKLEIRQIGPAGVPSIYAEITTPDGGSFHVVGSHPVPPTNARRAEMRNRQLAGLARLLATLDGPVVLLGDLNTTSWSPCFRDLVTTTKLRDSRHGFGNQPSWPSSLIYFGIAIDHVLVSNDIAVRDRCVGPDIGSDHRPVIADLAIPSTKKK